MTTAVSRPPWRRLVVAFLAVHVVLALPNSLDALDSRFLLAVPAELLLIAAAIWAVPRRARPLLRLAVVVALVAAVVLKLADIATFEAFGRGFHPVYDIHLVGAGWALLQGAVGSLPAAFAVAAVVLGVALVGLVLARALAVIDDLALGVRGWRVAAGVALAVTAAAAAPGVTFATTALIGRQVEESVAAIETLRAFEREVAVDHVAERPADERLAHLAGKDVLFLFIESYGRSALEGDLYAPRIGTRLEGFEANLAGLGLAARSGWLTSPVKGGQSWLAHATALSGLWIADQRRYRSLLLSDRETLVHGFQAAGWRTVAVMPAITMAWPEGDWFGYERIYAARDLGYRGEPFNWVTMPDQYTLAALNRLELDAADRPPVMAEVALISSHAPWTPIPPVLDWDDVGDGSVFTPYALSGDPPAVVWRDPERIRAQYLEAVDYALANLADYVARFGRDDLVLVVLGDHQPAPLVSGEGASFDVPIHVIAAPGVLARLDAWRWTPGMTPASDLAPWRMDVFRDRFYEAFGTEPSPIG